MKKKTLLPLFLTLPNGETISYRKYGQGVNILLLLHGNMSSSQCWETLMLNLPEKYQLYALDLRGFGLSSYITAIDSLTDLATDIKLFADSLGIKKFALLGWSTGGAVAMQFAADYGDYLTHLILIASVGVQGYRILKKDEEGQPIFGQFLRDKAEISTDKNVSEVLKAQREKDAEYLYKLWDKLVFNLHQPSEEIYREYIEENWKQRNLVDVWYSLAKFNISDEYNGVVLGNGKAKNITVPTLVVQGDRDRIISLSMAKTIVSAIAGPSKLEIFRNTGHCPFVDSLEQLIIILQDFINY